jgi:NAD(P)-dependent dehydrogenase (short-subunit alcohol dehydrogenase family)
MVYTPMMYAHQNGMTPQEREARKARSLLKTEGYGWDVGAAVRFLASDLSRWMTGKLNGFCSLPTRPLPDL